MRSRCIRQMCRIMAEFELRALNSVSFISGVVFCFWIADEGPWEMTCCCWCFLFQFGLGVVVLKGKTLLASRSRRRDKALRHASCLITRHAVMSSLLRNSWGWKKTNKVGRAVCFFHPPSSAESQKIKQQENKYERKTKQDRLYKEEKCFTRDSNTRQASSQRINFFPSPLHFHFTPVTHTTTWVDPRFDADRHALYCSFIHRFDTDHFHASCATLAQYRKHFTVGFPKVPPLSTEKKLSMSFTLDSLLYLLVQSWILSGRINFDYMAVGLRHCAERLLHPNTRDRLRSAERRSI
jgi:hypothetical protein